MGLDWTVIDENGVKLVSERISSYSRFHRIRHFFIKATLKKAKEIHNNKLIETLESWIPNSIKIDYTVVTSTYDYVSAVGFLGLMEFVNHSDYDGGYTWEESRAILRTMKKLNIEMKMLLKEDDVNDEVSIYDIKKIRRLLKICIRSKGYIEFG